MQLNFLLDWTCVEKYFFVLFFLKDAGRNIFLWIMDGLLLIFDGRWCVDASARATMPLLLLYFDVYIVAWNVFVNCCILSLVTYIINSLIFLDDAVNSIISINNKQNKIINDNLCFCSILNYTSVMCIQRKQHLLKYSPELWLSIKFLR